MKAPIKLTVGIVIAILAVEASRSASRNVVPQKVKLGNVRIYRLNVDDEFSKGDTVVTKKEKPIKRGKAL